MEQVIYKLYKRDLRKDSNAIGFYLFFAVITMYVVAIFMYLFTFIFNIPTEDTIANCYIQCVSSISCFFVVGLIFCEITKTPLSETINFKRTKFSTLILLVLLGYSTTFIANYLSVILNANLTSVFGFKTDIDIDYNTSKTIEKILYFLSIAIVPALVEEFTFRGIILGKLRKHGDAFALFISSLLFGMVHGNLTQIPFAFVGGLAFGFITIKANSLLPAIIVHFLNNSASVFIDIILGNNILSENLINISYSILMFLALLLGIFSVAILSKKEDFFKIQDDNSIISFKDKIKTSLFTIGFILFSLQVIYESYSLIVAV